MLFSLQLQKSPKNVTLESFSGHCLKITNLASTQSQKVQQTKFYLHMSHKIFLPQQYRWPTIHETHPAMGLEWVPPVLSSQGYYSDLEHLPGKQKL